GSPGEHAHHQYQRYNRPGHFNWSCRQGEWTSIRFFSSTVFEKAIDDCGKNEEHHQGADGAQRPVQIINLRRYVGSLVWEEREFHGFSGSERGLSSPEQR